MTTDSDTVPGFEDMASAATGRENTGCRTDPLDRRGRKPSPRVLNAGGTVLRMAGVSLIIGGFWPFIWTVLEAMMLIGGQQSDLTFQISRSSIVVQMQGWPAIVYGIVWSVVTWCCAVVAFALGHAMYVCRDLVEARSA